MQSQSEPSLATVRQYFEKLRQDGVLPLDLYSWSFLVHLFQSTEKAEIHNGDQADDFFSFRLELVTVLARKTRQRDDENKNNFCTTVCKERGLYAIIEELKGFLGDDLYNREMGWLKKQLR